MYCPDCRKVANAKNRTTIPSAPIRACKHCKQDFQPPPRVERGRHPVFCSADCRAAQLKQQRQLKQLQKLYAITPEELKELYEIQNGKCAICPTRLTLGTKKTHIDHDHATNQVRGLLCLHCNMGLGHFKDNPTLLARAVAYLE